MFGMRFAQGVVLAAATLAAPALTTSSHVDAGATQLDDLEGQFYRIAVTKVGGTYVTLRFYSKDPAIPFVAVGETHLTPKFANGSWDIARPKSIRSSAFPLLKGPQTAHEVTVTNLRPGKDHWVTILPKGNQIKKERLPGFIKFTTRHRKLHVSFERIEMIDDSDDLSDGDFGFDFLLLSNNVPVWKMEPAVKGKLGSGTTKSISVTADVTFDGDEVKIGVCGIDNDIDGFGGSLVGSALGLDKFSDAMAFPTKGNNEDFEWASGSTRINLIQPTQGGGGGTLDVTETFSRTFTVSVSGTSTNQIRFKVHGLLKVVYE